MSEFEHLLIDDHDAVRVLTLNRPEKKNALSVELAAELWRALDDAGGDDAVRALVLTGAGDAFCGGVDVHVFLAIRRGETEGLDKLETMHEALLAFPKPLVAAVNGLAVGMGVTLLPHFDLVYAAESASFMTPFVRLGLVLEYGSSVTLPRLIGRQRTNELVLSARPIDARTAASWGLVTRTFPDSELSERVLETAGAIAENPPGAVAAARRLIREGDGAASIAEAVERENAELRARYGSPENVAAVEAFLASRQKG